MIRNNEVGGNAPSLEATDHEVTPEMEDAGSKVLAYSGADFTFWPADGDSREARSLARDIYQAMASRREPIGSRDRK